MTTRQNTAKLYQKLYQKQFPFIFSISDSLGNHFCLAKLSKHLFQVFCNILHMAAQEGFKVATSNRPLS